MNFKNNLQKERLSLKKKNSVGWFTIADLPNLLC